jgi:enamine deaminase RidA (YjgF/YER057c/UK114 family)
MAVFIDRRVFLKRVPAVAAGTLVASRATLDLAATPMAGAPVTSQAGTGAPAFVRVPLRNGIIPHAGETSMELYHKHPHDPREEIVQPEDIRLQTRLVMRNLKEVLDWQGLGWRNIVMLARYQKLMDETPQIDAVIRSYLKDWHPPETIYEIDRLSSPQARLEIDIWVAPLQTQVVTG